MLTMNEVVDFVKYYIISVGDIADKKYATRGARIKKKWLPLVWALDEYRRSLEGNVRGVIHE